MEPQDLSKQALAWNENRRMVPQDLPKQTLTWNDMDSLSFLRNNTIYALAVDLVLYPSDLLATRLQADRQCQGKVRVSRLLLDIFRREGPTALFRGFGVNTLGHFPGQFLYYWSYEYCNEQLRRLIPDTASVHWTTFFGFVSNAGAGLCAEMASAFSYLPTDIVTQRLQVHSKLNTASGNFNLAADRIVRHIYRTEGIRGFYRGFGPYILTYGPGSAVWWASYEASKTLINRIYRWTGLQATPEPLKVLNHLVSGGLAGAAGYLTINPLEVAKTRLQLLEVQERAENRELRRGYFSLLRDVYQKEGIRGLYKGIRPRLLIRVPVSSVAFIGYEYLKESSRKADAT